MEGKFASEGLQALDGDDDMLTAMARELVQNRGIGESADFSGNGSANSCLLPDRRPKRSKFRRAKQRYLFGSGIAADSAPIHPSIDFNSTSSPTLQLSLF